MSGFEIVGLIGAIPGVVELVTESISLIHKCTSSSKLAGALKGAELQLVALRDLLITLERRCKDNKKNLWSPSDVGNIDRSVKELRDELGSLKKLLTSVSLANTKGERRLMRRVLLVFSGYENDCKEQLQRIEAIKSLLTLTLTNKIDGNIEQAIEDASQKRKKSLMHLKKALQPCNADFIPPKLSGTLSWVLEHPQVVKWMDPTQDDLSGRALCFYGVKGCGKSVLASSLSDDLATKKMAVAFFSFWAQSGSQRKTEHMLATLAWKLISLLPDDGFDKISPELMGLYKPTPSELVQVISQAIQLLDQPSYLIIDGIDESTEDWNTDSEGLRHVLDLLRKYKALRVLLLGRETSVRATLKTFTGIEVTNDLVGDDIQKLISEEISKLANINGDLKDHIQTVLTNNSTAMFLWVKLVFKELQRCFNASEMKLTLEHIPQTLEAEYDRLFSQLLDRMGSGSRISIGAVRAHRLFQLILGAMEPLSVSELRHAYAASCASGPSWEEYLLTEEGIIDTLGDFIHVSDSLVYLGHASVGEYLTRDLSHWPDGSGIGFFRVDEMEMHGLLARSCINYLGIVEWEPLLDSAKNSTEGLDCYPFLKYSRHRVLMHFFESKDAMVNITEEMRGFVQSESFCCFVEYRHRGIAEASGYVDTDSNLFFVLFSEFTQLASWYDRLQGSPNDFLHTMKKDIERRSAKFGPDSDRTTSWAQLMEFWEEVINLEASSPELHVNDKAFDEALAKDQQVVPGKKMDPSVAARQWAHSAAAATAIGKRAFGNHSVSGILRYALGLDIFKVNNWLPAPEDLIFEMVLKASGQLPVLIILIASKNYRLNGKLSHARKLADIARTRCEGKGTLVEALCFLNFGFLEAASQNRKKSIEYYRKTTELFEKLPSNAIYQMYDSEASCELIEELLLLGDEKAHSEALELLKQQTNKLLSSENSTSRVGNNFLDSVFSHMRAEAQSAQLLSVATTLNTTGDFSEALELSNVLMYDMENPMGGDEEAFLDAERVRGNANFNLKNYSQAVRIYKSWLMRQDESKELPLKPIDYYIHSLHYIGKTDQALKMSRELSPRVKSPQKQNVLRFRASQLLKAQGKIKESQDEIYQVDLINKDCGFLAHTAGQACHVFVSLHAATEDAALTTRLENNDRLTAWIRDRLKVFTNTKATFRLLTLCAIGHLTYSRGISEWSILSEAIFSRLTPNDIPSECLDLTYHSRIGDSMLKWADVLQKDGHETEAGKLYNLSLTLKNDDIDPMGVIRFLCRWSEVFEERNELGTATKFLSEVYGRFIKAGQAKPRHNEAYFRAWALYYKAKALYYDNDRPGATLSLNESISASEDIPNIYFGFVIMIFGHWGMSCISQAEKEFDTARQERSKAHSYCQKAMAELEIQTIDPDKIPDAGNQKNKSHVPIDEIDASSTSYEENPGDNWIIKHRTSLKLLLAEIELRMERVEEEEPRANFHIWQWSKFDI